MSDVWNHFERVGDKKVNCKICKVELKYTSSTSPMWNHLKRKHVDQLSRSFSNVGELGPEPSTSASDEPARVNDDDDDGISESQNSQSSTSSIFQGQQRKITDVFSTTRVASKQKQVITGAIAKMVAEDMLPISFVEGSGFKRLMKIIVPYYTMPCRTTIKTHINVLYDLEKNRVQRIIDELDYVALTTDCWTSRKNDSYMTVTLHGIGTTWSSVSYTLTTEFMEERHTSENLRMRLEATIKEWKLNEKVFAVVHDNAANIVNAIVTCREVDESVCCFAHTLQLCINNGLDEEKSKVILGKCSGIVGYFKHSTVATNAPREAANTFELPEHKLIQSVKTRWNSVYYMLERLIEQRQAITYVMNDRNVTSKAQAISFEMTESDWNLVENLSVCLKPFALVTALFSSESSPTISMVQPVLISITDNFLAINREDVKPVRFFKETVLRELRKRFHLPHGVNVQNAVAELPDIATFLDARYKNIEKSHGIQGKAKRHIENILDLQENLHQIDRPNDSDRVQKDKSILDLLFPLEEPSNQKEIDVFMKEPPINKKMCPLQWWKNNENRFPAISKLAKKYLAIPATSTPAERVFSAAGNIVTAKRNCLSHSSVNTLTFLHNNLKK